jgi:hypothetical protein
VINGEPAVFKDVTYEENGDSAMVTFGIRGFGRLFITLSPESLELKSETGAEFGLEIRYNKSDKLPELVSISEKRIRLSYNGFEYGISLEKGYFTAENAPCVRSESGVISVKPI